MIPFVRAIPPRFFAVFEVVADLSRGLRPGPPTPPESPMPSRPSKRLQTFPNPSPRRDYRIHMEIPEFTCLCPMTGQPDFAVLSLEYVPDRRCVELKSLKLYAWSFRDEGAFHEAVTNRILDDLVRATRPRFMRLTAKFNVRGGIHTSVVAEHRKRGWRPQA
jgi:7-cyano-7-deazaguanine reductase